MACLEYACEAEAAVLPDQPADVGGVGFDVGVAGSFEALLVAVWYCEAYCFAAEPIACLEVSVMIVLLANNPFLQHLCRRTS